MDPREQTEEPPASRAADDLGVERDELARVFKETEAAVSGRFFESLSSPRR